jgi:hypothetical protein
VISRGIARVPPDPPAEPPKTSYTSLKDPKKS